MVELEIAMGSDLIAKTRELAVRYFGDDSNDSLAQVLELAFMMRSLWSRSVKKGKEETDESVSKWEFPESPVTGKDNDDINRWLFRR